MEVSDQEIAARGLEGDAATAAVEQTVALQGERTQLIDRVNAVLDALENKGGEVAEQRTYVTEVSGIIPVDVEDVGAAWTFVVTWVMSEEGGIRWGLNILKFILVLIVFKILSNILGKITQTAVNRLQKGSDLLRKFCVNFVRKGTFFVGVIMALSMLEVPIGPFLAVIGAAGFIVGFALQGTLNNFASGIMILVYRPYDVGDVVSVSGVTGKVSAMSLVSTTVKTPDNQVIMVPNGSIFGGIITNITGSDTRRVDMIFGIGYGDDIARAQKILEEVVGAHDLVLKDPEPVIKVHELADSSVNFVVRPWSKTGDYWDVYWDITRKVKERFDAEKISIPFPQQDVYVHQVGAEGAA